MGEDEAKRAASGSAGGGVGDAMGTAFLKSHSTVCIKHFPAPQGSILENHQRDYQLACSVKDTIPQLNGSRTFSSWSCTSAWPFWFRWLSWSFSYTRHQMEGQPVTGWPRMVERPRESASRTTSIRGLISPGPDRRVPESITRPSPRPVAWGLLPSDEPAARTGRQAHRPGRHGTAPTTGWLGMSSWRPPRPPWLRRFPSCFPGPCRPRPEQRGGSSVKVTNAGGRTAPPTFADSPPRRLSEVCRRGRA